MMKSLLKLSSLAVLLASPALAETSLLQANGLGFLFARYGADGAAACDAAYLSRSEAHLSALGSQPVVWLGSLRIPEGQAARQYGQPAGFATYQVFGQFSSQTGTGDVFHTFAYLSNDRRDMVMINPANLNAPDAQVSYAIPGNNARIPQDPAAPGLLALMRCPPRAFENATEFKKRLGTVGEGGVRLPTVRVIRDVNYRSRPDRSGRKLGAFKRGDVLKFTGFTDGWYEFDVDGQRVYSWQDFFTRVE